MPASEVLAAEHAAALVLALEVIDEMVEVVLGSLLVRLEVLLHILLQQFLGYVQCAFLVLHTFIQLVNVFIDCGKVLFF